MTPDNWWSEKLTWTFCSGELKKINFAIQVFDLSTEKVNTCTRYRNMVHGKELYMYHEWAIGNRMLYTVNASN